MHIIYMYTLYNTTVTSLAGALDGRDVAAIAIVCILVAVFILVAVIDMVWGTEEEPWQGAAWHMHPPSHVHPAQRDWQAGAARTSGEEAPHN